MKFRGILESGQKNKFDNYHGRLRFDNDSYAGIDGDSAIVVGQGRDTGKVYEYRGDIYLTTNKYEKTFKDIDELITFLNRDGWHYVGIDDI